MFFNSYESLMRELIDFISQPWPWHVSGLLISGVMILMIFFGKKFGVSSNLRTVCSIAGAGKFVDYFKFDWKKDIWNLTFVLGAFIGGFIANNFLTKNKTVAISTATKEKLLDLGFVNPGQGYIPTNVLSWEALSSIHGWLFVVVGGMMVGFGTRYAGGCTSGHAISGLSNLQLPSLVSVIGFFIGGLLMTWVVFPMLFTA